MTKTTDSIDLRNPKRCVSCGASFARSRSDYTVRCPDCRAGRTKDVAPCVVCNDARWISSRTATRGDVTSPCYRCNPDGTDPGLGTCAWFAGCGRPATGSTSHPVLGSVPTCDRCAAFVAASR